MRILGTLFLIGAGALTITAIVAAPRVLKTARPLLREGLKQGMEIYARLRTAAAEVAEDVEDIVAEVRAEVVRPAAADASEKG